ncbi:MAG: transporter substrate-binding domain-containing protein [Clostridium sp.]|uniref:transporter substrate-binding domain-containing protein n=1 Tax=Clostridium sp. TaxID=1506 RepID=UPI002FCB4393
MKKVVFIMVHIFFLVIYPSTVYAQGQKIITIGGDCDYPPYEFVDKDGKYKGFNVDIMNAVAAKMGYKIDFKPMKWSEALDNLKKGKLDAVQGMSKITTRENQFIFSNPYTISEQVIFTKVDTSYISDISDLRGRRVGVQNGDVCMQLLTGVSDIKIVPYKSQREAMNGLLNGELEAVIGNKVVGLYEIQKNEHLDKVKFAGDIMYSTEYGLVAIDKNKDIITLFNKGLEDIKKSGDYERIHDKWFGSVIGYSVDSYKNLINGTMVIGTLITGIVIATLLINKSLKHKVEIRTRELEQVSKVVAEDEERYRKFIEACPDAIFTHDLENKIIFINDEGRKLLGAENKSDIIGRNMSEFAPNMIYVEEMVGSYFSGKTVYNKKIRKIDGTLIDVDIRGAFVNFGGKENILSIVRDISDRKRLYEAIEYDRIKTEFFSNMSHELRTPLNVILASLQLMESKIRSSEECEQAASIEGSIDNIRHNGHRLLRLVNNLIDITKIDSGYISLNLSNGNIVDAVESTVDSVIEYAKVKNIDVIFDTEEEEIIMAFDDDKIERIMLNLLANSVKFSKEEGEIFVNIKRVEDRVAISVRDNGIGIPEDKIPVVFERFRQVNKTLTRSFEGSGIGLSLVKSLIEMQEGEITVESVYGMGSTFTVYLPIKIISEEEETISRSLITNKDMADIEFSDIT